MLGFVSEMFFWAWVISVELYADWSLSSLEMKCSIALYVANRDGKLFAVENSTIKIVDRD